MRSMRKILADAVRARAAPRRLRRPAAARREIPAALRCRSRRTPTLAGRIVAARSSSKNLSGIRLLTSGEEALADLIALADHAERTLDIQYYIIQQDESARLLLHHVRAGGGSRRAGARPGRRSQYRRRRPAVPASEPTCERRGAGVQSVSRRQIRHLDPLLASSSATFRRINHRMHNKLFVADNALAITGGRNIGDQYFTRDKHSNFIDLDVVAAGAIVPQLSASFDAFWNSKYAYPIASLAAPVSAEPPPPPPPTPTRRDRRRRLAGRESCDTGHGAARSGCPPRCSRIGPPRSRARPLRTKR